MEGHEVGVEGKHPPTVPASVTEIQNPVRASGKYLQLHSSTHSQFSEAHVPVLVKCAVTRPPTWWIRWTVGPCVALLHRQWTQTQTKATLTAGRAFRELKLWLIDSTRD